MYGGTGSWHESDGILESKTMLNTPPRKECYVDEKHHICLWIKILEAMKDKFSQTVAVQAGNATCRACRIYPLCHGGCTQMKLEYKAPVGCLKGYTEEQKTKILSGRLHEVLALRAGMK